MGARVATNGNTFAMRSPVNWALLGLLIERTGYGYDLFQRFERTYGGALELSCPAQIYKALTALEGRGLIERLPADEAAPAELRQPKPHYGATAAGVRGYQRRAGRARPLRAAPAPGAEDSGESSSARRRLCTRP